MLAWKWMNAPTILTSNCVKTMKDYMALNSALSPGLLLVAQKTVFQQRNDAHSSKISN
jgi:hypothetical protein